jgi:hypothetical protein
MARWIRAELGFEGTLFLATSSLLLLEESLGGDSPVVDLRDEVVGFLLIVDSSELIDLTVDILETAVTKGAMPARSDRLMAILLEIAKLKPVFSRMFGLVSDGL